MIPFKINNKPLISIIEAEEFVKKNWKSINPFKITELVSYDSRTYLVESNSHNKKRYILKIANAAESRHVLYFDCISKILNHLQKQEICTQHLIKSTNGDCILDIFENHEKKQIPLKSFLLSYIEGQMILNTKINERMCYSIGKELSRMTSFVDQISSNLEYLTKYYEDNIWNVEKALKMRHFIPHFDSEQKRALLTSTFEDFEKQIIPNLGKLTKGFIHGDPNELNLVLTENNRIGFIDWQDSSISYKIYDLSILIFSLIDANMTSGGSLDPIMIGKQCLHGYQDGSNSPLNDTDTNLLLLFVQTRVAMSLSVGYYSNKFLDAENNYVLSTQKNGWMILEDLIRNRERFLQEWI